VTDDCRGEFLGAENGGAGDFFRRDEVFFHQYGREGKSIAYGIEAVARVVGGR
jgi:hypothetical protein